MMKKLLLILLCLPMIGLGQGWETTCGGTDSDEGYSVEQTNDGGYIVCGKKDNYLYLIKTDGNGVEQWSQTFGSTMNGDDGQYVQQTNDGGYVITVEKRIVIE